MSAEISCEQTCPFVAFCRVDGQSSALKAQDLRDEAAALAVQLGATESTRPVDQLEAAVASLPGGVFNQRNSARYESWPDPVRALDNLRIDARVFEIRARRDQAVADQAVEACGNQGPREVRQIFGLFGKKVLACSSPQPQIQHYKRPPVPEEK